jgi:hypothetical protein
MCRSAAVVVAALTAVAARRKDVGHRNLLSSKLVDEDDIEYIDGRQ